tara:strand:+ start:595 stop:1932 length:1338 start_codon:yes stop_codon:yes gene_type:complete
MGDAYESTSELGRALGIIQDQQAGVAAGFGEMAQSSKTWNFASRLISGTGLWRLQNRIRAVGNMVNIYNDNLSGQAEAQRKALDSNMQLTSSLGEMQKAYSQAESFSGGLYEQLLLFENLKNPIVDESDKILNEINAQEQATMKLMDAQEELHKVMRKRVDIEELGRVGSFLKDRGYGKDKNIFAEKFKGARRIASREGVMGGKEKISRGLLNARKKVTNMFAKLKVSNLVGAFKAIGTGPFTQLVTMGVFALGKLLIYFSLAMLLFGVLYRSWPTIKKVFTKALPHLEKAFENIKGILLGVYNLVVGLFQGDFRRAFMEGLWPILKNMMLLMKNLLFALGSFIVHGLHAAFKALRKKIPFMASGGVSSGGLTVVGERGPELVSLPSGARVHSNRESRGMGGSTIHVHVSGRVGANDAEIKDIANKVAREINLRMNRTGASAGRF